VYLTARSYLLAGFTATSIVAAISTAPNTIAHVRGIDTAQVHLSAADSEIASKMRTFRNAEIRTVSSLVDGATTVVGDLTRPRAVTVEGHAVAGAQPPALNASGLDTSISAARPNTHQSDAADHVRAPTPAAPFDPSAIAPLIGDVAAFNFDLLGTPFALVSALSAGGDVAIADLSNGLFQDLLRDVTNSLEFNIGTPLNRLNADIDNLTHEINKLSAAMNRPAPDQPNSTVTTPAGPATAETPTAANPSHTRAERTPIGSLDPSAIGPLIGHTAMLALDVGTVPFEAVTSLTNAMSGAAQDLGAGQFEEAKQFVATELRGDVRLVEQRLASDLKAIGANVAQLTGTSRPVSTDATSTIVSSTTTADAHAAPPPSTRSEQTSASGRRGITEHTPSAAATKPVTSAAKHSAPNNSTRTQEANRRGGATNANAKPAAKAATQPGGHKHHTTTTPKGPSKAQHTAGGKHRKK
jgi:hypothetical protein